MQIESKELRQRVVALGRRTRGARIPEDLREEIVRHALERRRRGDAVRTIARSVGVAPESVRRWTRRLSPGRSRSLVPVVVRDDLDDAGGDVVTVTAPGGYRVEGLTVASAAALLRHLA